MSLNLRRQFLGNIKFDFMKFYESQFAPANFMTIFMVWQIPVKCVAIPANSWQILASVASVAIPAKSRQILASVANPAESWQILASVANPAESWQILESVANVWQFLPYLAISVPYIQQIRSERRP